MKMRKHVQKLLGTYFFIVILAILLLTVLLFQFTRITVEQELEQDLSDLTMQIERMIDGKEVAVRYIEKMNRGATDIQLLREATAIKRLLALKGEGGALPLLPAYVQLWDQYEARFYLNKQYDIIMQDPNIQQAFYDVVRSDGTQLRVLIERLAETQRVLLFERDVTDHLAKTKQAVNEIESRFLREITEVADSGQAVIGLPIAYRKDSMSEALDRGIHQARNTFTDKKRIHTPEVMHYADQEGRMYTGAYLIDTQTSEEIFVMTDSQRLLLPMYQVSQAILIGIGMIVLVSCGLVVYRSNRKEIR